MVTVVFWKSIEAAACTPGTIKIAITKAIKLYLTFTHPYKFIS
jgi:hypothetical protein